MRTFHFRKSCGFTLVELLTVIIIIAVLAGLVTGAVNASLNRAARNLPKTEVTTAAQASVYQIQRYPAIVADAAGLAALQARLAEGAE